MKLSAQQQNTVNQLQHRQTAVIIAPTGAGKTATLLHTIMAKGGKWIVACPAKVVQVWPDEVIKWQLPLSVVSLIGTPEQRQEWLQVEADIYVVSLNNLEWLLNQNHSCNSILIDELSKACGKQTTGLKKKAQDKLVTRFGMTATPVSENFQNLYGMFRIIDPSVLGTRKESYMTRYFYPTDYKQYNWELKANAADEIMRLISPNLVTIDYDKVSSLPPKLEEEVVFTMPVATRKVYDQMREDMLLNEGEIIAANAAVLTSKLRQIASGFALDVDGNPVQYDTARADAALSVIDSSGEQIVVIYEYDHQRAMLETLLEHNDISYISVYGGSDTTLDLFLSKRCRVLIAQQRTLSHGVDGLQNVCHKLMFFQPLWSADVTEQAIGRVWRQGQTRPVEIIYLIADNTIDDLVINRVDNKGKYMKLFMEHIKNG